MKRLGLLTWLLLTVGYALAAEVTEQDARREAETFLRQRGRMPQAAPMRLAAKARRNRAAATDEACSYYVFNVGSNNGFVVVSGDDRTDAILGYADSGMIDLDRMPDALKAWLEGYADQMAWLDEHPHATKQQVRRASRSAIAPLITTRWNQGAPYNLYCPVFPEGDANAGKQCAAGCVATSMAQLMYYHQWPKTATPDLPGYKTRNGKFTLDALSGVAFQWAKMQKTYVSSADLDIPANAAVAQLMQYCGWALQMNYNTSSSAYNVSVAEALKQYFDYDNAVEWKQRAHYSYTDWLNIIYDELAARRPVVYGGQSAGGGHSFICDGYDTDDFFHFNWGWGGSSDGYFRLSLLNPWEQGIGGSSTNDGFNYDQDIIVNIKRRESGSAEFGLVLEGLQFTGDDTSSTQVVSRTATEAAFENISLLMSLCNYNFEKTQWDYQLQLVDGDGVVKHIFFSGEDEALNFNTAKTITTTTAIIPADVPDGHYSVVLKSRPHGESYWAEGYSVGIYGMQADISGNTLTLTTKRINHATATNPTCSDITVNTATPTKGYEVSLTAHLEGGALPYNERIMLQIDGANVMGRHVDLAAGAAVDVNFTYVPKTAGTNKVEIWTKSTLLKAQDIAVAESDATDNLTLTFTPTITNLSVDKLYGNAVRLTLKVANESKENSYVGQVNCSLRKYKSSADEIQDYAEATVQRRKVAIDKGSSTNLNFDYDDLDPDGFYRMRITYVKDGATVDGVMTGVYGMGEGYAVYNADGTSTIQPLSGTVDAGSSACLDLRAVKTPSTLSITTSTNPNCLYLLSAGAEAPSSLEGKNVVNGETAETISISDGSDFYSPIDFTAESVSYSRTFTKAADGTNGWDAIILPFTVQTVKADGKPVDWFHSSSDTGKNFWVKTFTGDDAGTVYFDFASEMKANTPYIIAMPGDKWGEAWRMTGKDVTFEAANQAISATKIEQVNGNVYNFCGATNGRSLENVYMLNDAGTTFGKKTSATSAAFQVWFSGSGISPLGLGTLTIASGMPTAIDAPLKREPRANDVRFDLLGRPCHGAGSLYIINGKKYLKK